MVVTLLLCKNLVNRIDSLQKDHRARKSYVCVQEHAGTACPIDKTIASKSKPLLYSLAPHQSGGYLPNQPHCMRDRTPVHLRRPPPRRGDARRCCFRKLLGSSQPHFGQVGSLTVKRRLI